MQKYVNNALVDLTLEEEAEHMAGLPTAEDNFKEKVQAIEDGLDVFIDDVADAKGYGTKTMAPTAACMTYAGYDNQYRADGEAFGAWKASLWPIVFQIQADYLAGEIPEPTLEIIISELPPMVWPI